MAEASWGERFRDAEPVQVAGSAGFDAAVTAFTAQLDAPLTGGATDGHCVGFYTTPGGVLFARYRMRGEPVYVRFEAGTDGALEAWVECITDENQIVVLRWSSGAWSVIGHGVATALDAPDAEPGAADVTSDVKSRQR
jgi:hypothetical protein